MSMGPGGVLEPFDPNGHRQTARPIRRGVHDNRKLASADPEQGQCVEDTPLRRTRYSERCGVLVISAVCLCAVLDLCYHMVFPPASNSKTSHKQVHNQEDNNYLEYHANTERYSHIAAPGGRVGDSINEKRRDEMSIAARVADLDAKVREMKSQGVVMEEDVSALALTADLQQATRQLLHHKYGPGPYRVELILEFPASFPGSQGQSSTETLLIEMAPVEWMPHAVFQFLQIASDWKGGSFHRNAGHVLQAKVDGNFKGLAWQEYDARFPHLQYSLGFAGRPGGPAFYISTVDNTQNHGPGSQGSQTEADSCFAKIVGRSGTALVDKMRKQPGAGHMGFVEETSNHIRISAMRLILNSSAA